MADTASAVLVCAVPGTGLTKIGDDLGEQVAGSLVIDLENRICGSFDKNRESYKGLNIPGRGDLSMRLVAGYPRSVLKAAWDNECGDILDEVASAPPDPLRAVFLHLTWYDSKTSEFYSPVNTPLLARSGLIGHVILLIDDIYDMYCRLRGPRGLYGDRAMRRDARLLSKLTPEPKKPDTKALESLKDYKKKLEDHFRSRRVEALELALQQLIMWRRAEMILAENIALTLGADFTLLGTKHSNEVLKYLARPSPVPKTYISHRISAVRRKNKEQARLPGDIGDLGPLAEEVNRMHLAFARKGQVLINPTAIDELRFGNPYEEGVRSPYLSARWPLPDHDEHLLWSRPDRGDDIPEHTRLLSGELDDPDPISPGVARSLSNQIFFDIAFRDHMIVEHTPSLCVFRPFIGSSEDKGGKGADWSRGVFREIERWRGKVAGSAQERPKLAFVHTRGEIAARLQWLSKPPPAGVDSSNAVGSPPGVALPKKIRLHRYFADVVEDHLRGKMKAEQFDPKAIDDLFEGKTIGDPDQLGRERDSQVETEARKILDWISFSAKVALHQLFTTQPPPHQEERASMPDHEIGLFVCAEGDDEAILDREWGRLIETVCGFFAGDLPETEPKDRNSETYSRFWAVVLEEFKKVFGEDQDFSRLACLLTGIPYDDLVRFAPDTQRA